MNTNTLIKLGVPILVLGGIIAIIVATQKPVERLSFQHIDPFDFSQFVDGYIADSIEYKTMNESRDAYNHLYEIIATEASITITTQSGNAQLLSTEDANSCYEKAFKAYYDVYASWVRNVFGSSIWEDGDLKLIKDESLRMTGLQGSQCAADSLKRFGSYVDGYYSALNLINRQTYGCSSASLYDNLCSKASSFKYYPYTNCSKLDDIESVVADKARKAWQNAIERMIGNICSNSNDHYGTYPEFYNGDYTNAYNKINEYRRKFNTSWGSELIDRLNQKDKEMKNHFNIQQ